MAAAASSLDVQPVQIKIVGRTPEDATTEARVMNLTSEEHARSIASKVMDPSALAMSLRQLGLGSCNISPPEVVSNEADAAEQLRSRSQEDRLRNETVDSKFDAIKAKHDEELDSIKR